MRKAILATAGIIFLAFPLCYASPQQESVAEAARKAREQKKTQLKAARVVTNDELAAVPGHISVIGAEPAPAGKEEAATKPGVTDEKTTKPAAEKGEAYWRKRFADARGKLRDAEKELDILQRELNLNQQQYYSDPNTALREQYQRKDINDHRAAIESKRKEVAQLRQVISDLEDELRRAGGDSSWARE